MIKRQLFRAKDTLRIRYVIRSSRSPEPREYDLKCTVHFKTGNVSKVSASIDGRRRKSVSEADQKSRICELYEAIQSFTLSIPLPWTDHSKTRDGWKSSLTIAYGYEEIQIQWFSSAAPEWKSAEQLGDLVANIAHGAANTGRKMQTD